MDEELKALIEKANAAVLAQKNENAALQTKFEALAQKHDGLQVEFDKVKAGGNAEEVKALVTKLADLQSEMSDLRSKHKSPISVVTDKDQKEALVTLGRKAIAAFAKVKNNSEDFFDYIQKNVETQCKALNISTGAEGGFAVAEILSQEIIKYARDFSPVLGEVGFKPSVTRNYRQLVRISTPSVQEGIENVAGIEIAETSTPTYAEVRSSEFKVNAKPRITDEAMLGTDIDVYNDLLEGLGEEMGIYLANQVLFGNGVGKNCRGILSSNRVNITNLTGESWKPTLGAGRRNSDFYPAYATGVSGSIGADDKAKVDFVIKAMAKLPRKYRANAKWYMNETTKTLFELVRDANNNPIFRPDFRTGEFNLNGKPVVIDDTLPNVAANSLFAIYGDLSKAFIMNNGDIDKMLVDPYSEDGCTVIKMDKEFFEMVGRSDAIIVCAATTNGAA